MVSISEKKEIISDFLEKCNAYSDSMIKKYHHESGGKLSEDELLIQDKIVHWMAYKAFNDYAIEELKTEQLDDWFD